MGRHSWYEGYDAEYEYAVDVGPDRIVWHLEFDEQWSDPPRDEVQSFEDFMACGHPSGFSGAYDDVIRKEAAALMAAPGYVPFRAPAHLEREPGGDDSVRADRIPPAEGPMKTSWERRDGSATHSVDIHPEEVVVATSYPNPHAGGGGASATHTGFLGGELWGTVLDLFGRSTLVEVLAYVKRAPTLPEFMEKRESLDARKAFVRSIPVDPRIKAALANPAIVDGFRNYGNRGGYVTELRVGDLLFHAGGGVDYVEEVRARKRHRFDVPGTCTSVVGLGGRFYFTAWDNFWVVDGAGRLLYDTYSLTDAKGDRIFGEALRVDRVMSLGKAILVRAWWLATPMPRSCLRFDPDVLAFTGRWDEEG